MASESVSSPSACSRGDALASLHSTETVEAKKRNKYANPAKRRSDLLYFGRRPSYRRLSDTTAAVTSDAVENGDNLQRANSRISTPLRSQRRCSKSKSSSPIPPKAEVKKTNTAKESSDAQIDVSREERERGDESKRAELPNVDGENPKTFGSSAPTELNSQYNIRLPPCPVKPLIPVTATCSNTEKRMSDDQDGADAVDGEKSDHHVKAPAMGSTTRPASASHTFCRLLFPSFSSSTGMSAVPPTQMTQPLVRHPNWGHEYDLYPKAQSPPAVASSVPVSIPATASQQPSAPPRHSVVAHQRKLVERATGAPAQPPVPPQKLLWLSIEEWNSSPRAPEDPLQRAKASEDREKKRSGTNANDGQRRNGAAGAANATEPVRTRLRDYRFASFVGQVSKASPTLHSFAFEDDSRQTTFVPSVSDTRASLMWRSAFGDFLDEGVDEQEGNPLMSDGLGAMTPAPHSLYGPFAVEGELKATYSSFSPAVIEAPAGTDGARRVAEKKGVETERRRWESAGRRAVSVISLGTGPPVSKDDDDHSNARRKSAPPPVTFPRPSQPLCQNDESQCTRTQEGAHWALHSRRGIARRSSLFLASRGSFFPLSSIASAGGNDFWDALENADEDEGKEPPGTKGVVSAGNCSTHSIESEYLVGIDRKATMYGRMWLVETGKGVIRECNDEASSVKENRLSPAVREASLSPHHRCDDSDDDEHSRASRSETSNESNTDDSSDGFSDHSPTDSSPCHQKEGEQQTEDQDKEEVVVDVAALQHIMSEVGSFCGSAEGEGHAPPNPTAPAPPLHLPRWERPLNALPVAPFFLRRRYIGHLASGFSSTHPNTEQPWQQCPYNTITEDVELNGSTLPGWCEVIGSAGAQDAVLMHTDARDQVYQAPPTCSHASNSICSNSYSGPALPFRQTAAGPKKVHEMLRFDPLKQSRWVKSPDWGRLPSE
ncbi:hypothetical protein ABL78_3752 [Leptomonas seymouri]|uniref:Uncharacterized protein n=1 Tax=Leptomonas seymouri TaxID=5684 RepID=A0A0N1I4C2_LEPSE|nr:hypothetical protein ABL78_3752 [Leptomonas seymouri]|eukprot:KPI87150.1 hypothetical protein ABL78_3752 [Leptomonas seymouri]